MKEYKPIEKETTGMVSEPGLSYSSPNAVKPPVSEFSDQIMDMLLQQPIQVKLLIINKLAGSMLVDKETGTTHENPEVCSRKEIEAKLDNLHVKGHLRRLFGAAPFIDENDDWKKEKEACLRKKYGM